ncbi:MAG TPA: PEP-CTERM sorting domain-containing protein [Candidatus Acidoferrum sp.]|nr:PEP-CTERM sorting domain-containing protein [Candidatus Acidoferrum sp.]
MKHMKVALYLALAAVLCLLGTAPVKADIITLEDQSGPSLFGGPAQTLNYLTSSGPLAITGGTVLTNTSNLPADQTSVYGTVQCCGYASAITLTFTSPINNFFFDLLNGNTVTDTYLVSDNLGNSASFTIAPNTNSGAALVSFPSVGSVITISCSSCGNGFFDFFVDNIGFNQATPGTATPEPGTMLLLGVGVLGLAAVKLSKR